MRSPRAALYARVSSEQQAHSRTIASQVASLRERITADGARLEPEHAFLDESYSGATLLRPALERLRDAVAAGAIDRIYVHSPDRLARAPGPGWMGCGVLASRPGASRPRGSPPHRPPKRDAGHRG